MVQSNRQPNQPARLKKPPDAVKRRGRFALNRAGRSDRGPT